MERCTADAWPTVGLTMQTRVCMMMATLSVSVLILLLSLVQVLPHFCIPLELLACQMWAAQ